MASPVTFSGGSSVNFTDDTRIGFPIMDVRVSGVTTPDYSTQSYDAFIPLIVRFSGASSLGEPTVNGITGIYPYDELSKIFMEAVAQGIVSSEPYSESASRVKDINAALSKTPTAYDEKSAVVKEWLA